MKIVCWPMKNPWKTHEFHSWKFVGTLLILQSSHIYFTFEIKIIDTSDLHDVTKSWLMTVLLFHVCKILNKSPSSLIDDWLKSSPKEDIFQSLLAKVGSLWYTDPRTSSGSHSAAGVSPKYPAPRNCLQFGPPNLVPKAFWLLGRLLNVRPLDTVLAVNLESQSLHKYESLEVFSKYRRFQF